MTGSWPLGAVLPEAAADFDISAESVRDWMRPADVIDIVKDSLSATEAEPTSDRDRPDARLTNAIVDIHRDDASSVPLHRRRARPGLYRPNVVCLGPLAPAHDIELHALTFIEGLEALALDVRIVHEHILFSVEEADESEAFFTVEKLHCSRCHELSALSLSLCSLLRSFCWIIQVDAWTSCEAGCGLRGLSNLAERDIGSH